MAFDTKLRFAPFLRFAFKNILRHKVRSILTLVGIAASIAVLFSIISFNRGFERGLSEELERTGIHFMVVPAGCPHKVASLVLHGSVIPQFIDIKVIEDIKKVGGIELISPMLTSQLPNHKKERLDLVYGMEMSHITRLKPNWQIEGSIPARDEEIIIGYEIAAHDNIKIGDTINYLIDYSNHSFKVSGILQRTGGQDDAFVYMPIKAMQAIINRPEGVTTIGVRVSDPTRLSQITDKLYGYIPGIQIVTMSEVISSISALASSAKVLSLSMAVIAILISAVGVMNSILMSIFERTHEIGMMRAIGASKTDIFRIIIKETTLLTISGGIIGVILAMLTAGIIEGFVRGFMPYVPSGKMISFEPLLAGLCVIFSFVIGIFAGLFPAWKASKISPVEAIKG